MQQLDTASLCPECEVVRSYRSKHCAACGRCVERYDHHCPWIDNCVGVGNHAVFYVFVLLLFFNVIFCLCVMWLGKLAIVSFCIGFLWSDNTDLSAIPLLSWWCPSEWAKTVFDAVFWICIVPLLILTLLLLFLLWAQTGNIFLGRTTYERFSKSQNNWNRRRSSEIDNTEEAKCRCSNCYFMCCNHTMPDQRRLEDSLKKSRESSGVNTISDIHTDYYRPSMALEAKLENSKDEIHME